MWWAEGLGFVTGALSVWLYARQRVGAWPIGIANSAFWLVVFWGAKLYFDSGLQVVYIGLGAVGWYWWRHGRAGGRELPVSRTSLRLGATLATLGIVATTALCLAQARWTDGALPFWDSSTTVVSLIAQYMLTRKLLENWVLWIAVDLAYIGMYASQELYLTAALQPLFIGLCVLGIRDWRRSLSTPVAVSTA